MPWCAVWSASKCIIDLRTTEDGNFFRLFFIILVYDMRVRKWWWDFHFCVNYFFKYCKCYGIYCFYIFLMTGFTKKYLFKVNMKCVFLVLSFLHVIPNIIKWMDNSILLYNANISWLDQFSIDKIKFHPTFHPVSLEYMIKKVK